MQIWSHMPVSLLMWLVFGVVVLVMLVIDLRVFHKLAHEVRLREAVVWSIIWILVSLGFGVGIYFELGAEPAVKFFTGYLIEKALSMDNLFVFLVIFSYFGVPSEYQHNVLFWGILGALVFRAIFIAAGVTLIQTLAWSIYVLGAFLIFTGIKLVMAKDKAFHPEKNITIRIFRRFFPLVSEYHGSSFFVRVGGVLKATPLLVTLIVVETTDVVFATDSIPAILGITTDPFLVYSSNIFAILGLRALYFVLAGIMSMFRFLHYGLALILVFVGAKMLLGELLHMHVMLELAVVVSILVISVLVSLVLPEKKPPESDASASES